MFWKINTQIVYSVVTFALTATVGIIQPLIINLITEVIQLGLLYDKRCVKETSLQGENKYY